MNGKNKEWRVELVRADGIVCRWSFKRNLNGARDLVREYVRSCPYDCEWTMTDGEIMIEGRSETREDGRGNHISWNGKDIAEGKKIAG